MQHNSNRWMVVVVLIIAGLQLSACTMSSHTAPGKIEPVIVEPVPGTELNRVILTAKAAQRLDIKTVPVRDVLVARSGNRSHRKVVRYSAVLYDKHGNTWVYTSPKPLTYLRDDISVDYIEGDLAVLSDGPPSGTEVVTVGAAELFSAEFGVGP